MPTPLLQVRDLSVDLARGGPVLSGLSFDIPEASIVGLFGESGCGKTTLALALMGLLDPARYRVRGAIESAPGARTSMVFQDPMLALNPVLRVGVQVREVLHARRSPADPLKFLELAGLRSDPRIARAYPHQLSGGERQRVLIAQALACEPALIIADEPFTALDPIRVVELASLFRDLRDRTGTSFLLISHSPGVLARIADSVLVMQAGEIVEQGPPRRVFGAPEHPYTAAVVRA